ncbi:MAG: enoyl-CoA hydratase/isomerase family protein [Gammaproteobacteria bacterium]|nr:enoyl-CoA hydratase/isomerase family protein [Gammaproteobacteria bacterium]
MGPVIVERAERVVTVTLNRPGALNALDDTLAAALFAAVGDVEADPGVRCVVMRGAGGNFMAGGDLRYFQDTLARLRDPDDGTFTALFRTVHGVIGALARSDKIYVASVAGAVAGFGLSLMNACDLAVAADDAQFTLAYTGIGATPDGGVTWHLPRLVGLRRALGMALLNERRDARWAEAAGLVNAVVPTAELGDHTTRLAARLAAGPAGALAATKRLLRSAFEHDLATQLQAEEASFRQAAKSEDFAEGVRAFCAKRPPRFDAGA